MSCSADSADPFVVQRRPVCRAAPPLFSRFLDDDVGDEEGEDDDRDADSNGNDFDFAT